MTTNITTTNIVTNPIHSFNVTPLSFTSQEVKKITISANDAIFNMYLPNNKSKDMMNPEIIKIEILVPNKVLRFTFKNGTQIKTVCNNEDTFNFNFAIYLAFAKLIYENIYTREGIEHMAHEMTYQKKWVKMVKETVKMFKAQEKARIKQEQEEKERAAARKRQAEKKARKKRERREKQLAAIAEKVKMM